MEKNICLHIFGVYLIAALLYNSLMNACPVNFKCDKRIQ